MQKAIAYVLYQEDLGTRAARLELLAVMVRRNWRHGVTIVGMAPGPFVVFTLVPLLRAVVRPGSAGPPSAEHLAARFNAAAAHLLRAFSRDADAARAGGAGGEEAAFRVRALVSLTCIAGCALTHRQAAALLDHVERCHDMSEEPRWVEWGALPTPPPLSCEVRTARFRLSRRDASPATFRAKVTVTGLDAFTLRSYKGVEWAAVQLATPGAYFITAHDLGIAHAGGGDTRGEELCANWRLTVGDTVMPEDAPGYSRAGMAHTPVQRWAGRGRGGGGRSSSTSTYAYRHEQALRPEELFVLHVTPTQVALRQNGNTFIRCERRRTGDQPLLAFKNMWLAVQYKARGGEAAARDGADATPMERMAELRIAMSGS